MTLQKNLPEDFAPSVTIIINTDGRAKSLAVTLDSLRYLNYENFEVVVIYGPTRDGTEELLQNWSDQAKIGHCRHRNLSESRNIGLAMAAGEIVAFLDDDAIPEPEWLNKVTQPFKDSAVGGVGGFLYDHTGVTYQWRFGTADRTGGADESWDRPARELNFPYTANFPQFVGANSVFRLSALFKIGGFDEQYAYYLDETDVICRLVDDGWKIEQIAGAAVHHKFLASHLRNDARILTSWYPIIRSKIYFSLVNAQGHHDILSAIKATEEFAGNLRRGLEWHISEGRAEPNLLARFDEEYRTALKSGLEAGVANARIFFRPDKLGKFYQSFKAFVTVRSKGRKLCICLLSRSYPPRSTGGIGRYVGELGRALAALGHQVRILTENDGDTVDFEDGVWVHRRRRQHAPRPLHISDLRIPQHIWDYSATMRDIVEDIAIERPVDAVIAPIWDCEGAAFLFDRQWPILTSLHTNLASYLDSNPHLKDDEGFAKDFATPMLALEHILLSESDGIVANSDAIVRHTESQHGLIFENERIALVPHGMSDWTTLSVGPVPALPEGAIRLVFVGRLEERKGIDVLLAALERVLPLLLNLYVDIVGDNSLNRRDGVSFSAAWLRENAHQEYISRVRFCGQVDDETLRGYYAAADIFIAPSRFESFGLIFLEAMMFGKPVIGCRAGGVPEVVTDGVTGILVEPDNVDALVQSIAALVADPAKRQMMGLAGRQRYLDKFAPEIMARGLSTAVARFSGNLMNETA